MKIVERELKTMKMKKGKTNNVIVWFYAFL